MKPITKPIGPISQPNTRLCFKAKINGIKFTDTNEVKWKFELTGFWRTDRNIKVYLRNNIQIIFKCIKCKHTNKKDIELTGIGRTDRRCHDTASSFDLGAKLRDKRQQVGGEITHFEVVDLFTGTRGNPMFNDVEGIMYRSYQNIKFKITFKDLSYIIWKQCKLLAK